VCSRGQNKFHNKVAEILAYLSCSKCCTYSCNGWTGILSWMWMCYISTKYNCWSVTDKRNSPCQSIYKYSIPSPNLKGRKTVRQLMIQVLLNDVVWRKFTLTFILRATFARYCLLILKTCLVRQHWETNPRSVSHILLRSPDK
jgi:hypothetical protein